MSWFCSVGEKSFNQKDSTERHVMSKHCYAGLTPFQTVLMFSQKCQRFHIDHPFTSMIAGMTGSGKTTSNKRQCNKLQRQFTLPRRGSLVVIHSASPRIQKC